MTTGRETSRDYEAEGVVVHWKQERCSHSGMCYNTLPEVFRPDERPWVVAGAAPADQVLDVVELCPTGALTYTRTAKGSSDMSDETAGSTSTDAPTITVTENGPYEITGQVEIRNDAGELVKQTRKTSLCRCGASGNKPFCDGSHEKVGFEAPSPSAG